MLTSGIAGAREGRPQRSKIFGDVLEIGVGQKFQQIVHRRISAPPVPECHQLVIEIAGGFAGQPREIDVAGALALRAVARSTAQHPRRHRVRRLFGRNHAGNGGLCMGRAQLQRDQQKTRQHQLKNQFHRKRPSSTTSQSFAHLENAGNESARSRLRYSRTNRIELHCDRSMTERDFLRLSIRNRDRLAFKCDDQPLSRHRNHRGCPTLSGEQPAKETKRKFYLR